MNKARLYKKKFPSYALFEGIVQRVMREPYTLFLDGGKRVFGSSRYSFLALNPFLIFTCRGQHIHIRGYRQDDFVAEDPFEIINELMAGLEIDAADEKIPFVGGAAGYLGYDMARVLENIPSRCADDIEIPDAFLGFYSSVIAADHTAQEIYALASGLPETDSALQEQRALAEINDMLGIAGAGPAEKTCRIIAGGHCPVQIQSNFDRQGYENAVREIKAYIAEGEVYQVNLSQRFECCCAASPFSVYDVLRRVSPAPYSCFFNGEGYHVLSASPESFLQMAGSRVVTRPIKGTRPRGGTEAEDRRMKAELLNSVKDRAELLMITDLERNDLGKVCKYGSIYPEALFALETYSNVFHLVSTIIGELNRGISHVDCLKDCFPGGSITGAPKIRSMEIIEMLERCRRKIYTGTIGYFGFNRVSDFNIVIRTLLHKDGKYYFNVGGGIVADSDPALEYEETLHKARGMMEALQWQAGNGRG